jgi:hypothetical protein
MKDMSLTKAEAKDQVESSMPSEAEEDDLPKYPYGLTMYLQDEVLLKLGMKELPQVGSEMVLTAKVIVTGINSRQTQGEKAESCADIQITAMDLTPVSGDRMGASARKLYRDSE